MTLSTNMEQSLTPMEMATECEFQWFSGGWAEELKWSAVTAKARDSHVRFGKIPTMLLQRCFPNARMAETTSMSEKSLLENMNEFHHVNQKIFHTTRPNQTLWKALLQTSTTSSNNF